MAVFLYVFDTLSDFIDDSRRRHLLYEGMKNEKWWPPFEKKRRR